MTEMSEKERDREVRQQARAGRTRGCQPGRDEDILRGAGLRATPQRLAILHLMKRSKEHPSPEMVYRWLKPEYPGLSLNTVYQTLHALEGIGLVRRISMEENIYRFDANVAPHVHLVCRRCGVVADCDGDLDPLLRQLAEKVHDLSGWEVFAQDFCFYGHCPRCREAAQQEPGQQEPGQQQRGQQQPGR